MKLDKSFFTAVAVLVGTCIGGGILGLPYVSSRSGFFVALGYVLFLGLVMLFVNLCLGEIALRTKEKHQIAGYARIYLGRKGERLMQFATIFGIYSAIIAFIVGVGDSLSFLILGNISKGFVFGLGFSFLMCFLLWGGISYLKRYEKIGVAVILFLLVFIFILFFSKVDYSNIQYFDFSNWFLPFGVVLFALMSFHAIPEVEIILEKKKKLMKKVLIVASLVSIVIYSLFAFVVVGFMGLATPEIATLGLGGIFVLLGIFTMFTTYLALGNALFEHFEYDDHDSRFRSWFLSAVVPIFFFLFLEFFEFFSFTMILSIGGVVSAGLTGILVLFMLKSAKKKGSRKPEYEINLSWIVVGILSLIFILGILIEVWKVVG